MALLSFLASNGQESPREPGHDAALEVQEQTARTRSRGYEEPWQEAVLSAPEDKKPAPGPTLGACPGTPESSSPHMRGTRATFVEHEQQAPGQSGPKEPWQGAVFRAAEEGKKPPGTLASPWWGKKSLPPPQLQGTRGRRRGARAAGSNLCQRDERSRDKWSCSMLQRKAKNPRGAVPMCPGGKFLPDPSAGDRLFLSMGSRPGSWSHRLVTPPGRCPSPTLSHSGAI